MVICHINNSNNDVLFIKLEIISSYDGITLFTSQSARFDLFLNIVYL